MPCGETTSRLTASRTPLSSSGCILPASSDAKLASSLGSDARLARWTPMRRRTSVLVLDCVLRMATLSLILVHNTSQHSRSSPMSKTTKSTHTHTHTQPTSHTQACMPHRASQQQTVSCHPSLCCRRRIMSRSTSECLHASWRASASVQGHPLQRASHLLTSPTATALA